jgi:hypothetical protein
MKKANAEKILAAMQDAGMDAELYEDYSGRGMFGRTTTGIVCGSPEDAAWAAGQAGVSKPRNMDNMGLQYIVY